MPRQAIISTFISRAIDKYYQKYTPDTLIKFLKGFPPSGKVFVPFFCQLGRVHEANQFSTVPIRGLYKFIETTFPFKDSGLKHPQRYIRSLQTRRAILLALARHFHSHDNLQQKLNLWLRCQQTGTPWFYLEKFRKLNPEYISKPIVMQNFAPNPRNILPKIMSYCALLKETFSFSNTMPHPHFLTYVN